MTLSLLGFISRCYFITVPIQPNETLFVGILTLQSTPNDWSLSFFRTKYEYHGKRP